MLKKDLEQLKDVLDEDSWEFLLIVAQAEEKGERTARCECGGIIHIAKSSLNGHIHARCERCGSEILQ